MTNFNINPTGSFNKNAQFIHADGSVDDLSAKITFTADRADLLQFNSNPNAGPNNLIATPIMPAAAAGGVTVVTGTFLNENSVQVAQQFSITVTANPNPAVGFVMQ